VPQDWGGEGRGPLNGRGCPGPMRWVGTDGGKRKERLHKPKNTSKPRRRLEKKGLLHLEVSSLKASKDDDEEERRKSIESCDRAAVVRHKEPEAARLGVKSDEGNIGTQ
jgi:hypothetical protein